VIDDKGAWGKVMKKTVMYNLTGTVEVAVQKGTEPIDISKLFERVTTITVKGDDFDAEIVFAPLVENNMLCRIGLVLREGESR